MTNGAGDGPSRAEIDASLRGILVDPAYRFCNETDFTWKRSDWWEWCESKAAASSRCAAVAQSCQASPEPRERSWHWPSLGPAVFWLFWTAFFAAIAVFLVMLLRRGRLWRRDPTPKEHAAAEAKPEVKQVEPHEIEVDRLLARARRVAAEGRFGDAIGIAYSALLRHLERERLIRLHPSRTNGDYLRDLRPRAGILESVQPIVREVERVQFGHRPATFEQFETVFRSVASLVEKGSAGAPFAARLASTLVIALCCSTFTSCSRWFLESDDYAPSGTRVLVDLLQKAGFEPRTRMRPWKEGAEAEQIVLLPQALVTQDHWRELMDWTSDGGTLVIANGDLEMEDWLGFAFASDRPPGDLQWDDAVASESFVVVPGSRELRSGRVLKRDRGATPEPMHPLLSHDGHVYAARFEVGEGEAIVLADGLLFTNLGLSVADNAITALRLLDPGKKPIDLVAGPTDSGAKNPFDSVKHGRLAPTLVQVLLLLALLYLQQGFAFGTLVDPPEAHGKSFALHVRALGLLYAKAQAASHACSVYAAFALERLRGGMSGEAKGLSALAESVTARSGLPLAEVSAALERAEKAKDGALGGEPSGSLQSLDLVRQLSRILRQVALPRAAVGRRKGGSG